MSKTQKLLEELIEVHKETNKSIQALQTNLQPKWESLDGCIATINSLESYITNDVYSKEETIKMINKEYDYKKEYEECLRKNEDLLYLVEKYCKYRDKYDVIRVFKEISEQYVMLKVKNERKKN